MNNQSIRNVKLHVNGIVIDCDELICDIRELSIKTRKDNIKHIMLGSQFNLKYVKDDLQTMCEDAVINKFQVDTENSEYVFVRFEFKSSVVTKSKYKVLMDTVEYLLDNVDTNMISINLNRQAGHTTTLLKLMNKHPDAVLVLISFEAKNNIKNKINQLQLYDIHDKNIVVINEGANIPALFQGKKYNKVLIDDFSSFTKNCVEKIFFHTKRNDDGAIRYVCLG